MKILLTGKTGQIGWELERILPSVGDVVALDRQRLDLSDPDSIRRAVNEIRPNLIVNAAAYTAVDQAEDEPDLAQTINAEGPGILAEEAKKVGAALIHYSTDYVFDGGKTTPYTEDDPTNPLNVYGKTKLSGEQAIQAVGVPYLIFRTSWIYSTRGKNFLLTILRLASEREELRVVNDQIGCPNWSRAVAEATVSVIKRVWKASTGPAISDIPGIYHMSGTGETTWYEFAKAIVEKAGHSGFEGDPKQLRIQRIVPIATSEFPTRAQRPGYSLLSSATLQKHFGARLTDWQRQLKDAMNIIRRETAGLNAQKTHLMKR